MRYRIFRNGSLTLKAYGENHEELFSNAASGLMVLMFGEAEKLERRARGCGKITVKSEDYKGLLAGFLNKVLSEANSGKKIFPRVKILRISPRAVEAQLFGVAVEKFDEDIREVHCDGEIREKGGKLEADLVLKSRHSAIAGKLLE